MLLQGSLFTSNVVQCVHIAIEDFYITVDIYFLHISCCEILFIFHIVGFGPVGFCQDTIQLAFANKMLAQQQQLPVLICSWNNVAPTLTAYHNNKFKQFCANHEPTLHQPKTNSVPTPGGLSNTKYNMDFLDNS